ncbi:MAG TPA: matrixin family metalloprotease [Actinomycetota bacterium]|nr:matrixin family metalloprotease [Actinomycetota bacterium]
MRNRIPPRPDLASGSVHRPRRRRGTIAIVAGVVALCAVAGAAGWALGERGGVATSASPSSSPPASSTGTATAAPDLEGPYRFLRREEDGPLGWDPCLPIPYEVNLRDAPANAMATLDEALSRIEDATGFTFTFEGTTTRGPVETHEADFLDDEFDPEPVLVSWLEPDRFSFFAPPKRAAAVGTPRRGRGPRYDWYTSGLIVVNTGAHANAGWAHRWALGPVLLHEWGHVLGLAHVQDTDQIMWSRQVPDAERNPSPYVTDYGEGDLGGLARLAQVPCAV